MATTIPNPPPENTDPWFTARDAFDQAVKTRLNDELSDAALAEVIRDTMGTALVAGANVTITVNDGADTITVAVPNAVPSTLVDAKGDLLVATADNTLARVPVGTAGQVLTADAAQAAGVKWATPSGGGGGGGAWPPVLNTGEVWTSFHASQGSCSLTLGRLALLSIIIDRACTLNALAVSVSTAGSGAVGYVGIYASNSSYANPHGAPLASGSFDASSTGAKQVTGLSAALAPGMYWVAVLPTVAAFTVSGAAQPSRGAVTLAGRWMRDSSPDSSYTSMPTLDWGTSDTRGWGTTGGNPLVYLRTT